MTVVRDAGLPVTIFRPGIHAHYVSVDELYETGTIAGDSATGALNEKDFVTRILASTLQLRAVVSNPQTAMNLSPVDFVSSAIVHLSLQPSMFNKIFHMVHTSTIKWRDVMQCCHNFITDELHSECKHIEFMEWRKIISDLVQQDPKHPLAMLLSHIGMDLPNSRAYQCKPTMDALKETKFGRKLVEISKESIQHYLKCIQQTIDTR